MSDLIQLTIAQARDKLRAKEISATELTQAFIKQMDATRDLNAYITETPEIALAQAAESDARIAKGQMRPMEGIPIGMKDLFCTKGTLTTAGSKILGNFIPPYESTVSGKLWNDGCVMLGKTNMDEFAMGSANLTSAFGPVKNPWRATDTTEDLVPGGSSGGSAAAIAANSCMAATGTDTGGSIRQPASFSGIVGMKPSYGTCSRFGIIAFASSLDQAGPMTHTVRDSAIMLTSMAGYDPQDATSSNRPSMNFEDALTGDIRGMKIGIPKEYRIDGTPAPISKMWDDGIKWLHAAGAETVEVTLPHTRHALPTYYIIAPAEASSNLARYDGLRYGHRVEGDTLDQMYENSRAAGFGAEVQRRILIGTYVLSAGYYDAYFVRAQRVRHLIRNDFDEAFKQVDAILSPTTPSGAFSVQNPPSDPVEMYMNDVLTVPASLAGLPCISVPAALTENGRPLGLQVIGPAFRDDVVFRVGQVLEDAADFKTQVANLRKA